MHVGWAWSLSMWLVAVASFLLGYAVHKAFAMVETSDGNEREAYDNGFQAGYDQCDYDRTCDKMVVR